MMAPTPDWFVGVIGLNLLDATGSWEDFISVNLFPYDAGTEEGVEFTLSNQSSKPHVPISLITEEPFPSGTLPLATIEILRLD
jgi:hypothetical protein